MDILNKAKTGKKERPIKVVQFGEGNFLRGFVDYMIDIANEQGKFRRRHRSDQTHRVRQSGYVPQAGLPVHCISSR